MICIGGNSIGDEGARALAQALEKNTALTGLYLCKHMHLSIMDDMRIIAYMHSYLW